MRVALHILIELAFAAVAFSCFAAIVLWLRGERRERRPHEPQGLGSADGEAGEHVCGLMQCNMEISRPHQDINQSMFQIGTAK